MRKIGLYTIYDRVAEIVAGPIMSFKGHGPAIRYFHDGLSMQDTTLNKHPEDYDLIQIGEMDEETGEMQNGKDEPTYADAVWPKSIAMGSAWLAEQQEKAKDNNGAR